VSFFTVDIRAVSAESNIVLGAHRGANHEGENSQFIESTREALQAAVNEDKYKFIEIDVQYTKDKKLIVHHGEVVLIRDLPGIVAQSTDFRVKDNTYEELQEKSPYHILMYGEAMDLIEVKPVNVEIKSQMIKEDDLKIAEFIAEDAERRGIDNRIMISSISSDPLEHIKKKYPEIKTGKIYYVAPSTFLHVDFLTSFIYKEVERINADYLLLHGANLRNHKFFDLRPEDTTLIIWYSTVDNVGKDKIYLIDPKPTSWLYGLQKDPDVQLSPRGDSCWWWC